jgi:hypothetical protein
LTSRRFAVLFLWGFLGASTAFSGASPIGLLGQVLELPRPRTFSELLKLERNREDQKYIFDDSFIHRRLDHGLVDPYLDTAPYKNDSLKVSGKEVPDSSVCFGLVLATIRWWQDYVSLHIKGREDQGLSIGSRAHRLRDAVSTSKQEGYKFLREARRHQDEQGGARKMALVGIQVAGRVGWRPSQETIYLDHLLPNLQDPRLGMSDIGFLAANVDFRHTLMAYGLVEGVAQTTQGETHRVRAIRVECWDSNFPIKNPEDGEAKRSDIYLLYFPRAGRFSFPDTDWRNLLAKYGRDHLWEDKHGDSVKSLDEGNRHLREGTIFQQHASFIGEGNIVINKVHDAVAGEERLAAAKRWGTSIGKKVRNAIWRKRYEELREQDRELVKMINRSRQTGATTKFVPISRTRPKVSKRYVEEQFERVLDDAFGVTKHLRRGQE